MSTAAPTTRSSSSAPLITTKFVTLLAFVLSVYFNFKTAFGRHFHGGKHYDSRVGHTPFTANILFVFAYWIFTYISQLFYLANVYAPGSELYGNESIAIGWHFSLFNILQVLWSYFFSKGHFVLSEIVLIINFFNLLSLYVSHKTYAKRPVSKWFLVHIPITVLPLVWVFYAIFWNGAVMVGGATSLAARILANVFIWDFLLVPALYLVLYRDWAIGLAFAYISFGIAFSQFLGHIIALQWIFALVIGGLLTLGSLIVAVTPASETPIADAERAPLLNP